MKDKVIGLAGKIFLRESKCRPETEWIQHRVNRFAEKEGICSKAEIDRLIYEKMYSRIPEKKDTVKIRYWRTGHHLPSGRKEALLFAKALQLDEKERAYLLQACMDKSDLVFEEAPDQENPLNTLYKDRVDLMETMISEYIAQIPPARMIQLKIPYERLAPYARHLYCMDAINAAAVFPSGDSGNQLENKDLKNHFSSMNYESEFLRIRKMLGEIPRRTMLRHIFLLGIPYLSRRLIDERLSRLGYLPLTEGHTAPSGAAVDDLVIGFLDLYGEACRGRDPLICRQWIFEQLCILDRYLQKMGKEEYRFLYFRSLSMMMND